MQEQADDSAVGRGAVDVHTCWAQALTQLAQALVRTHDPIDVDVHSRT